MDNRRDFSPFHNRGKKHMLGLQAITGENNHNVSQEPKEA